MAVTIRCNCNLTDLLPSKSAGVIANHIGERHLIYNLISEDAISELVLIDINQGSATFSQRGPVSKNLIILRATCKIVLKITITIINN